MVDGVMRFEHSEIGEAKVNYLPVAIFANAMSRCQIIDFGSALGDRLNYIDTDALHFSGDLDDWMVDYIDPVKLGYFKVERQIVSACYKGLKKYAEWDGVDVDIKCAGLSRSEKLQLTFDDFVNGSSFVSLRQKNISGGAILVKENFTI